MNSGPAPANHTDKIYELTKQITEYSICPDLKCDICKIGTYRYSIEGSGEYVVEVIDSVKDYCQLLKEIFDFSALKAMITGSSGFKMNLLVNPLNGGECNLDFWTFSFETSISANADGPCDAASCKIYHTALPTEFYYQATSIGR